VSRIVFVYQDVCRFCLENIRKQAKNYFLFWHEKLRADDEIRKIGTVGRWHVYQIGAFGDARRCLRVQERILGLDQREAGSEVAVGKAGRDARQYARQPVNPAARVVTCRAMIASIESAFDDGQVGVYGETERI
jgi:hypothetical protein